jgi:hypothetical protein
MTDNESRVLMGFLRQLIQTRVSFTDTLAQNKINEALSVQPNASYLLVQRAIFLENELEKTKNSLASLQGQTQVAATQSAEQVFLNVSIDSWGKNQEARTNQEGTPKKKKYLSLEDRGLIFLMKNTNKLLALIIVCWAVAYFMKKNAL